MERFAESWAGARQARARAARRRRSPRSSTAPEAFTPDGEFILGETEVGGLWVAAGFCVHGLAGAGGVGKVMAEWIVDGQPEYDVAGDGHPPLRRALRAAARYARVRALGRLLALLRHRLPARGVRRRPAAARRRRPTRGWPSSDASFGEKAGWERVNWFEANAAAGDEALRPRGWAGRVLVAGDRRRVPGRPRQPPALFDQSSFAKLDVRGPGAAAALRRLCANDVDRPVGTAVYTQLLNAARRHRGRPDRDPPGRGALPGRHRHGVRASATSPGSAATCRRDGSVDGRRRHRRRAPASASGARPRARSCSR